MALNYKRQKNLVRSPSEYNRYYGDFRGVDFSSEETEVHEQRFAYAQNMYKDYRSSEGNVIETIPGFRERDHFLADNGEELRIYGIHYHNYNDADGNPKHDVLVHAGDKLFEWKDNEKSVFVAIGLQQSTSSSFEFNNSLYILDGTHIFTRGFNKNGVMSVDLAYSDFNYTPTTYKDIRNDAYNSSDISEHEYEQKNLFSPFYYHTYAGRTRGAKYPLYSTDEVNSVILVTPSNDEYELSRKGYERPNTKYAGSFEEKTYDYDTFATSAFRYITININIISFDFPSLDTNAPEADKDNPSTGTDTTLNPVLCKIKVKYAKKWSPEDPKNNVTVIERDKIDKCTIATVFDNRVFLSGNPEYPNTIWYCGYNSEVGYEDATYFGELDYIQDGTDGAISCMMGVSDTLAVLKSNARQSSSIYFHARHETGEPLIPITYPSNGSIGGLGEIYACTNFRDDPIFVSELGVEAIGQLSVRLERAMEHRSSLIDAKLLNCDLSKAKLAEWEGYLVVLVPDGKIFLADSRQRYTHSSGVMQYEWYYLEGIGIYSDYQQEYYYASAKEESTPATVMCDGVEYPLEFAKEIYNYESQRAENLMYSPVKPEDDETPDVRKETMSNGLKFYYILKDTWDGKTYQPHSTFPLTVKKAILCEDKGSKVGVGTFYPATSIYNIDRNLFFGTDNGTICSFNFDMREADGSLPRIAYNFNGVTINCGVATKLDNCGIPHLTKSTIKKSTVLKTKAMDHSAVKIKVRTNSKGYKSVARVNSSIFDMEDIDFSDLSFAIEEQPIFAIKEKEKHWVEKQHWIYSDEFEKPFAIHYLAFRYKVSGRIK